MRVKPTAKFFGPLTDAAKDYLPALALVVSLGMLGGCLMDPPARDGVSAAGAPADQSKALRDAPATAAAPATGNSGVPVGCSRVRSDASPDSVLYCPDVRPPKAR